jgi:lipopolysaccharide/colanic/teichoic acid biosynthesis glycosyltransferase
MQVAYDAWDPPEHTAVLVRRHRFSYQGTLKRVLDMTLAVLGLAATMPIWIAIAVMIRLDSAGPIFFAHERVGAHGKRFRFYKFRSMRVDADKLRQALDQHNEAKGPIFKMRNDPRTTRVGRILRRTSLDELPQLFNVLKGDMSFVGPRPQLPDEVEQYRPSDRIRLMVKPGLTCLREVRGRSELSFDDWMACDREYIRRMSFWLDVAIVVRTFWVVVTCRGAY